MEPEPNPPDTKCEYCDAPLPTEDEGFKSCLTRKWMCMDCMEAYLDSQEPYDECEDDEP